MANPQQNQNTAPIVTFNLEDDQPPDDLVSVINLLQNSHVTHVGLLSELEHTHKNVRDDVGEVKNMLAEMSMTLTSLQSTQNGLDRRTNPALEPDPFLPPGSEMDACQAHFPIDQEKVF